MAEGEPQWIWQDGQWVCTYPNRPGRPSRTVNLVRGPYRHRNGAPVFPGEDGFYFVIGTLEVDWFDRRCRLAVGFHHGLFSVRDGALWQGTQRYHPVVADTGAPAPRYWGPVCFERAATAAAAADAERDR